MTCPLIALSFLTHTAAPPHSVDDVVAECLALRAKETQFVTGTAHAGIYYEAGEWWQTSMLRLCQR